MNKNEEKKETPEEMLRTIQGIFCKGRYKPFDLLQEEIRKINKRKKKQTTDRDYLKKKI